MKKLITLCIAFSVVTAGFSQFKIETGATVTFTGSATLVLQDVDLINEGTINEGSSTIIFKGAADSEITSGGATLYNLSMEKDAGFNVIAQDATIVSNELSFDNTDNKFILGANDLNLEAGATVTGADSDDYVQADGTGYMNKEYSAAGTFNYPIGDASNYTPIESNFTGTVGAAAAIKAKVNSVVHPNLPSDASDYISRYWDVEATDITTYSNTLTGTYVTGDLTGMASKVKGAAYDGTDWSYNGGAAATNQAIGVVDELIADFSGSNFFGKVDVSLLLQGPFSGGTMSTNLTLPLTSPYLDAPLTVTTIPAGVVDWIKIQVRDASTPSTVVSNHSAFLKSDGSVVGEDGTALPLLKDANPTGYIAIYHRNHLPIRTASTLDLVDPVLHDFSAGLSMAYNDPSVPNDAMADVGGGAFALYSGDANGDGFIRYTDAFIPPFTFINSDALEVFSILGNSSNAQLAGYYNSDVNMDGFVRYTDAFIPPFTFINSDALQVFSTLGNSSNAQLEENID